MTSPSTISTPVPWDQHRAVLLLAREMCQTLRVVNPARVHDETLVEINDQLSRWENFQRIVAEAEAEYAAGRSLDSLDDKGGDAQCRQEHDTTLLPACNVAPTSDPAARRTDAHCPMCDGWGFTDRGNGEPT